MNVINARLGEARAPSPYGRNPIGYGMGAPTVVTHGSDVQKKRYLRPIFTGEEIWCQLFSEPGAGSDLAGLSTLAVRDGDEWIVNGQKVWTSGARESKWAILVARSDTELPKHRGLTFFICDMPADGVDIRPLRQADGGAHFNEVFLTDVRIPDERRLGDVGQGWGVSLAGLHSERAGTGDAFHQPIQQLVDLWRGRGDRESTYALALRDQVAQIWAEDYVLQLNQ